MGSVRHGLGVRGMKGKALVAPWFRAGSAPSSPDLAVCLSLPPPSPQGSGWDSVHPHPTPFSPPRPPRAHSVAPEGKLSEEGDVPGAVSLPL